MSTCLDHLLCLDLFSCLFITSVRNHRTNNLPQWVMNSMWHGLGGPETYTDQFRFYSPTGSLWLVCCGFICSGEVGSLSGCVIHLMSLMCSRFCWNEKQHFHAEHSNIQMSRWGFICETMARSLCALKPSFEPPLISNALGLSLQIFSSNWWFGF